MSTRDELRDAIFALRRRIDPLTRAMRLRQATPEQIEERRALEAELERLLHPRAAEGGR